MPSSASYQSSRGSSRARYGNGTFSLDKDNASSEGLIDGWRRTSARFKNRSARIRRAEMVRRAEESVWADDAWVAKYGEEAASWVEPSLPERKTLTRNLANALSEASPQVVRRATGDTDTDKEDAENLEQWSNAGLQVLYDHELVIGKGVEDAELLTIVQPEPSSLLACPQYMEPDGKGGRKVKAKYGPDLSGRKKHRDDMARYLANNPPIVVRQVNALDCAPVLVAGRRGQRFDCIGVFIRTLYDEDELSKRYQWDKLAGDRELIPRAFDSGSRYGRDGQVYLYEGFFKGEQEIDEADGLPHYRPYIVYCVGGVATGDRLSEGSLAPDEVVVIDLYEEYGIDYPLWHYDWGLHNEDDDPDFRGIPFLDPLIPSMLNVESLLLAHNSQAYENAFSGHVVELPPGENAEHWVEGGQFVAIDRPKTGEIKAVPGPIKPFVGAPAGPDAKLLEEFYMSSMHSNTPDEAQFGGTNSGQGSGRELVVERGLFHTAHRQIPVFGLRVSAFVAETTLRLAAGLAEGKWKGQSGTGVNLAFEVNVESMPGEVEKEATDLVEFNPHWVKDNYDLRTIYPSQGNLAEVGQLAELYGKHLATWDDLMEARGKANPAAERIKAMLDQYWESDLGQQELLQYALERSGRTEQAAKVKAQRESALTKAGMPASAVAPEAAQPPGGVVPPPGGPGPMATPPSPDMATAPTMTPGAEAMGQEMSAQLGNNTLVGDAQAASAIGQPNAVMPSGPLPAPVAPGMGM